MRPQPRTPGGSPSGGQFGSNPAGAEAELVDDSLLRTLTCEERNEQLLDPATGYPAAEWGVESSCTDLAGSYGEPLIDTTWGNGDRRIKDVRHPAGPEGGPDRKPCEHYAWREKDDEPEDDDD